MLSSRVLQLQQRQRHAVHQHQDVRPAILIIFYNRELVDRHPVVVLRKLEVDQPQPHRAQRTIRIPVLDGNTLGDELVQAVVLIDRALRLRTTHTRKGGVDQVRGSPWIDPSDRLTQSIPQEDLLVGVTLRSWLTRRDFGAVQGAVAQLREVFQRRQLDGVFVKRVHDATSNVDSSTQRANTLSTAKYSKACCSDSS